MPDQPTHSERFKADMPQIPGVNVPLPLGVRLLRKLRSASGVVIAVVAVLLVAAVAVRWLMRPHAGDALPPEPAQQIVVPTPTSDLQPPPPESTSAHPDIATTEELARPWSSKEFVFRNRLTNENVPALIIRLPGGSAEQSSSYWAFAQQVPFGRCQLEYITDLAKLRDDYGFRAKHPMVGDPCSRTVFDPLRMSSIPGGAFVRGAIAQGSVIRPPLGVEVEIRGNRVLATRME
ncbi:MAG: hypothetical protein ABSF92_05890 [Candidatus Acidiferrales bacterium]|jgi:hypothetical protein